MEDSTLVYSSLEELNEDVQYCNCNVLAPGTCLVRASTWTNLQQQDVASLDVMFYKNVRVVSYVNSPSGRKSVAVTGHGYVEVTLDTDAKWTIVGRTKNSNGLSVGTVEDGWKRRYGMFSSYRSDLFGPTRAVELLQWIRETGSNQYSTVNVDVLTMISWVKDVYIRDRKYVVPSSMTQYLTQVCNIPEQSLLKVNAVE